MLSHNDEFSFTECVSLCSEIAGTEKISFYDDNLTNFFISEVKSVKSITRSDVIKRLSIPSQYYINRGFSKEVLTEFDVGECLNPNSEMHDRVVFPIYDVTWKTMIGCVGRTLIGDKRKWKNQRDFKSSDYLFNYWRGFDYACMKDSAILVEGQGDVMRLWEAGHYNVFGLFGSSLSLSQETLLQKMGISNIITIADNDQAGEKLRRNIQKQLCRLFNVKHIKPTQKDVGEMSILEIKDLKI